MINATKAKLRRQYEHAGDALERNNKKTVKLMGKLERLQRDRDAWLKESERCTMALYKMEFPDEVTS